MIKELKIILSSLILILAISVIVSAAGDSTNTGGSNEKTCEDSDGGIDYYVTGVISINGEVQTTAQGTIRDTCSDAIGARGPALVEWICDSSKELGYTFIEYQCPNGCSYDGFCKREYNGYVCEESDGGTSYYVKGRTQISNTFCIGDQCYAQGAILEDTCYQSSLLYEYSCVNGGNLTAYSCPNGCINGACISTDSCIKYTTCQNGTQVKKCWRTEDACVCANSYQESCGTDTALSNESNNTNVPRWEGCDLYENRTERIKCRLENADRFENFSESDESCEGLRNQGLCVALYVRSQNCYKMEGENRDRCFKAVANFTQAKLAQEVGQTENKTAARENVRHYMILVLYNLQERVEKAVEAGRLTSDEGAQIINKIVEIKRLILEGATKETIRQNLQELKTMWRSFLADE